MDKKTDLDKTALLIDFNSPVAKRPLESPLIPIPPPPAQLSVSPVNSNPFDVVERQLSSSPDPFECVLKDAMVITSNDKKTLVDNIQSKSCRQIKLKNIHGDFTEAESKNETIVQIADVNVKEDIINKEEDCAYKITNTEEASNLLTVNSEKNTQSQMSGDESTEEGLKAVIAKRVNKCIQKVLGHSFSSKFSQSADNLKNVKNEGNISSIFNRRSLSFVIDSTRHTKSDRLNKSCADSSFNQDWLTNTKLSDFSDTSLGLLNNDLKDLSPTESKEPKENESCVFGENDLVFHEANKLARTFSKIAESFCQDLGSDDEDLLSCKPRWLYTDSSEDEEEKLRKDPALNIRVSLTPVVPCRPDSKTLSAFKTRRSLDSSKDNLIKEKVDLGSIIKKMPYCGRDDVWPNRNPTPAPIPVDLKSKNMKLKKTTTAAAGEVKRGPMKAVMPVQSMTKEALFFEDKTLANSDISPLRKPNAEQIVETPKRDHVRSGPVASSTPNNRVKHVPSPLQISAGKPTTIQKSGRDEIKHNIHTNETGVGARQRSNSSIPTPIHLKGGASANPQFKPKSTSSLRSTNSTNYQVKSQVADKKLKPTKGSFNSRALNEVKPYSPKPCGRVKTAVNTLSNLVTGKSRKVVSTDKENRVPV